MRAAQLDKDNRTIRNLILLPDNFSAAAWDGYAIVRDDRGEAETGGTWDGVKFSPPLPVLLPKTRLQELAEKSTLTNSEVMEAVRLLLLDKLMGIA